MLQNAVRLRLTQTEVQQIRTVGKVTASVNFGFGVDTKLTYTLQKIEMPEIAARYEGNEILISLPVEIANDWTNSDQISIKHNIQINQDEVLKILVEKDFKCLSIREDEDETDMFPNPNESMSKC